MKLMDALAGMNQEARQQQSAAPNAPAFDPFADNPSAWNKGLRRGLAGVAATGKAYGAQLVEPFAPEWSQGKIAEANAYMQDVTAKTPMVDRIENIKNAGDLGEWFAGVSAQAAPSIAMAAGGALAGRFGLRKMFPSMTANQASLVGGAGTVVPLEGGDTSMTLQRDPVAMENTTPWERLGLSTARGVVGGAMESIVPAMTVNKFMRGSPLGEAGMGAAMKHIGQTSLKGGVGEAFTEGGQHIAGTVAHNMANPDTEVFNGLDIANAMAAGFAPGMAMGGAGGTADAVYGNANAIPQGARDGFAKGKELLQQGYGKGRDLVQQGMDKVSGVEGSDVLDATRRAGEMTRTGVDKVMEFARKHGIPEGALGGLNEGNAAMVLADMEDWAKRTGQDAAGFAAKAGEAFKQGYTGKDPAKERWERFLAEEEANGNAIWDVEDPAVRARWEQFVAMEDAMKGYTGKAAVDDAVLAATGKTAADVVEALKTNSGIDLTNTDTMQATTAAQAPAAREVLNNMLIQLEEGTPLHERVKALSENPEFDSNHTLHREVEDVYAAFEKQELSLGRLRKWVEKAEKGKLDGKFSQQTTRGDVDIEGLTTALESYGITNKNIIDKLALANRTGFERQLLEMEAAQYINSDARRVLSAYAPQTWFYVPEGDAPKRTRKAKPQTGRKLDDLGDMMFNRDYMNSRVKDYVTAALAGTDFDNSDTRSAMEQAVIGLIEGVADGRLSNAQFESLRSQIESNLGESGKNLMNSVMDMAGYYTGSKRFEQLKNPKERMDAVDAIDKLMLGKTSKERLTDPRTALNLLMIAYLDDAESVVTGENDDTLALAELVGKAERLRAEGNFTAANAVMERHAKFKKWADKTPYQRALQELFGKKAASADAIVRAYARDVAGVVENNGRGRSAGTGPMVETDENDREYNPAMANDTLSDKEQEDIAETQSNETGVDGETDEPTRYFGQSARNPGKYDEYPGAPLQYGATYEHPSGESRTLRDEVLSKWSNARPGKVSVSQWAEEKAAGDMGKYTQLMDDAAKALIDHDARTRVKLKKLWSSFNAARPGETEGDARARIDADINAIDKRADDYKKANGNGDAFFAQYNKFHFLQTSPATGRTLEVTPQMLGRHQWSAGRETQAVLDLTKKSELSEDVLKNSLLLVQGKDQKILLDIAALTTEMMQRNPEGDIIGVGENGITPSMVVDVRAGFLNTLTSLMKSGLYADNMLVGEFKPSQVIYRDDSTGLTFTYGRVFGVQMLNERGKLIKQAQERAFEKDELSVIVPKADMIAEGKRAETEGDMGVGKERLASAIQGAKYIGSGLLRDSNDTPRNFNPRALLKAMMERYEINADEVLPATIESDGMSKQLTGELLKQGLRMLEKAGYTLAVGTTDFNAGKALGDLVLWESYYGGDTHSTTVSAVKNEILSNKEYTGTYDYRSDKVQRQTEILENQLEKLQELHKELETSRAIDPAKWKGSKLRKPVAVETDITEQMEKIERSRKKLQEVQGLEDFAGDNRPLSTDADEMVDARKKDARKDATLFDKSAELLFRQDGGATVDTWEAGGIAPKRVGVNPTLTNRQMHVNAQAIEKDIGSAAKQSVAEANAAKPPTTRKVAPVDSSAAGRAGKAAPVKPDTMTVENTTRSVNQERNSEYAKAGRYARYKDVVAALDARRAARAANKPVEPMQYEVATAEGMLEVAMEMGEISPADMNYILDGFNQLPTAEEFGKLAMTVPKAQRPQAVTLMHARLKAREEEAAKGAGPKFSKQGPVDSSTESADAVLADHKRRLGEEVDGFLRDVLPGYSGSYRPSTATSKALVEVSMQARSWQGTFAHEDWHAVVAMLKELGPEGQQILDTINKAMERPEMRQWLSEELMRRGEDPMADGTAFSQLTDPEERAAFAFQFFVENGGKMPLAPAARNIFSKLWSLLKKLAGISDDLVRTGNFFQFFDTGKFIENHKDAQATLEGLGETKREKFLGQVADASKPLRDLAFAAFGFAGSRIKALDNEAYTEIFERMHEGRDGNAGYMKEQKTRMMGFANRYVQAQGDPAKIEALIAEVEAYKKEAYEEANTGKEEGVHSDFNLNRKTFPAIFDSKKIEGRLTEFRRDLKNFSGIPDLTPDKIEQIVSELLFRGYYGGRGDLFMRYPDKLKKYASDDTDRQAMAYFKAATEGAELARAFKGTSLDAMLAAGDANATEYQRGLIRTFTNAAQGRAGMDMNPNLRKLFGAVITGVNLSLLPFAVFSQMMEPMQLAFRKNDLSSAVDSTFRGFKGLPRSFKSVDDRANKDMWEKIASEMGVVADAASVSMMADLMNEVPITGKLEKVNRMFFRYNGMEFWHRMMQVAATKNAFEFIKEHDKTKGKNSDALLDELGLKRGEVKYDADGKVDYNDKQMRTAIIRFVNESMAMPDAGTNAMWMNDPRLSLLAHLKRFTFGFAYYINKRAVNHIKNKEFMLLLPLALAVPWMIAADGLRDLVKPGDEAYKNNWGVSDYAVSGIERASLVGRYGIGLDVMKTTEYGGSLVEAISPTAQITGKLARGVSEGRGWETLFDTLPGHQLYGS